MVTLSLQWIASLFRLLFAVLAIRVAREDTAAAPLHRACWLLTGITFLVGGIVAVAQDVFGTWAFVAGSTSRVWALYLQVVPAMNHSRSGIEIALGCVLAALVVRGSANKAFWRLAMGALLLGLVGGALLGLAEGGLVQDTHYPIIGIVTFVELLVLLAMLLVAALRGGMDWMLWMILAFYALTQAFNSIWFVALAWSSVPEVWSPSVQATQVYILLFNIFMVVLAAVRLARAHHGVEVPTLLEIGEAQTQLRSLE